MKYYKVTNPDLTAKYDGKTLYKAGNIIKLPKVENPALCSSQVLHASRRAIDALSYYGHVPCAISEVEGTPVVEDADKAGFFELSVLRNIPETEYDKLLGFRYREVVTPVNPCDITPPEIDNELKNMSLADFLLMPS